jgi:hypothetical protein
MWADSGMLAAVSLLQERVVTFVLRQEDGSETISKAALLQFLQHEYEVGVCSGLAALQHRVLVGGASGMPVWSAHHEYLSCRTRAL